MLFVSLPPTLTKSMELGLLLVWLCNVKHSKSYKLEIKLEILNPKVFYCTQVIAQISTENADIMSWRWLIRREILLM